MGAKVGSRGFEHGRSRLAVLRLREWIACGIGLLAGIGRE